MTARKPASSRWRLWFVVLILGVLLVACLILFLPWNIANLTSHPRPVQSYAEALQRIDALRAHESGDMNAVCHLQLMTHDNKVARAVVLVHGYTSCPQQFHDLGQRFFDLGYNVLIAPLPHHGLADRMTDEQGQLQAEELAAYADEMVDIARGLGEHVIMAGLSAGGVTTAWTAQHRSDLDLAVVISPAFGAKVIPTVLTAGVTNLFSILPDSYDWWDSAAKAEGGSAYQYPRYSKRALAQIFRLGLAVRSSAQRSAPATHTIIVVTNANDTSVNNKLTASIAKDWREHGASLVTYEFDAALHLRHDLIGPDQPDAQVDIVYPRLIDLITRATND
jgi:alpha-beta hydrolase superfamily lysophospholipase